MQAGGVPLRQTAEYCGVDTALVPALDQYAGLVAGRVQAGIELLDNLDVLNFVEHQDIRPAALIDLFDHGAEALEFFIEQSRGPVVFFTLLAPRRDLDFCAAGQVLRVRALDAQGQVGEVVLAVVVLGVEQVFDVPGH